MAAWFKATRCSGEKTGIGEFNVEDEEGVEWQVTVILSKRTNKPLVSRPVVCVNRRYNADIELEGDIMDAVREVLDKESADVGT